MLYWLAPMIARPIRARPGLLLLVAFWHLQAQNPPYSFPDDARWNEIVAKHKRGQKITEEERDYYESKFEHFNQENSAKSRAEWAKAHPARESTGLKVAIQYPHEHAPAIHSSPHRSHTGIRGTSKIPQED